VADICNPVERRWRYAFTTCTHCGPRYTVTRSIPYDRAQTSLAAFPLCQECAQEYLTPSDRRFHAETTCCPNCGPRLQLLDASGQSVQTDPIAETVRRLRAGQILAIKGLGGFHLACDARNAQAVALLRHRKHREEKPLAVMALNAGSLQDFARIDAAELRQLRSSAAPIVLCRKGRSELPGVAPGLPWLGVMFASTPLHLLLWHEACGQPAGSAWLENTNDLVLVMSSANPQGEPLVCGNAEALGRLNGITDAFLMHDRAIVVRCDDSVVRSSGAFIRRARGFTPLPIALAQTGPTVLALGGHLKNTVCVFKGQKAYLSQHIGTLDNAASIDFLEESVQHLLALLDVRPDCIAHDLHPDFATTRMAQRWAIQWNVPAIAVAHHHAHIAAICAEHGVGQPVLGLAIDGVGLGPDGSLWGGELLRVDAAACERVGHLLTMRLPGGERAAREPWRMAVSVLHGLGRGATVSAWLNRRYPERDAVLLLSMLDRTLNCPQTSSMGRLFDAAAGLLGVRAQSLYEGQAAMELEGLAYRAGPVAPLPGGDVLRGSVLDFSPLLGYLADCDDPCYGAALFHATLGHGLARWICQAASQCAINTIAVGGGCAMNEVLMAVLRRDLKLAGLDLLEAHLAPPNDGALALGQGWVARLALPTINS
jgi:hydrogenase maturation protein HypF